jgi:hypothetical protein
MRNDDAMVSLEAVAREAAKVAVREQHDGVVDDDTAAEESCVAVAAVVAYGTSTWLLVDGDDTEVEDDDEERQSATPNCVLRTRPSMWRRLSATLRWRCAHGRSVMTNAIWRTLPRRASRWRPPWQRRRQSARRRRR